MAKIFDWFDNWKTATLDCSNCGWSGLIDNDHTEQFDQLLDFRCPQCNNMLAIINFPTPAEVVEHSESISAKERKIYDKQLDRDAKLKRVNLELPAQLPEIEADPLILVWDLEFHSGGELAGPAHVVIKHEGRQIWREQAYFECVSRFNEVADILLQKYGDKLKALIPTARSTTYLFGDIISSSLKELNIRTSYPGLGLTALAQAGDKEAINQLRYQRDFANHHLERADQLPDVSGDCFVLTWDLAGDPPQVKVHDNGDSLHFEWNKREGDGLLYVTLRHDDCELWREAATTNSTVDKDGTLWFDIAVRYEELAKIAISKYGEALKDMVPSLRSHAYLGGLVEDAINDIRSKHFPKIKGVIGRYR